MSVSWRIENSLVWLETQGAWSLAEWTAAVEGFLAHPDFRPGMGLVHDRRKMRIPSGEAAGQEVRSAIAFIQTRTSRIGKARWALVVADPVNYGMGRMAQALIEATEIQLGTFYDLADAEAWVRGSG